MHLVKFKRNQIVDRILNAICLRCVVCWCLLAWSVTSSAGSADGPPVSQYLSFQSIYHPGDDTGQLIGGVHAIAQDASGFMWFGGETALGRYDGRHTKLYGPQMQSSGNLTHGFVRRLLYDSQNVLWVATEQGLCRYDSRLDRFECDLNLAGGTQLPAITTQALVLDHTNVLYVGTGDGVYSISADRRQVHKLQLPQQSGELFVGLVVDLAVDHGGHLWVASEDNGLFMYSPINGAVTHYLFDEATELINPLNIAYNKLKCLMVDHQNRLWIGSFGGGFSILNAGRTDFQHYRVTNNRVTGLASNVIWDIYEDSMHAIWLAVDQSGLVRFNEGNGQFTAYKNKPYDLNSISSNQLRTITEDRNGDLWLGGFPYGVNFHNRATHAIQNFKHEPDNQNSLSHSAVLSIAVDKREEMWIGTENGLNKFNRNLGEFERFQKNDDIGLTANAILSIDNRDDRSLWVGTWSGGLLSFDLHEKQFSPLASSMDDNKVNSLFIWDILTDNKGQVIIASEFDGINILNAGHSKIRHIKNNHNRQYLPHNFVWDVLQDQSSTYWVATQGGLIHLDAQFEEIERFPVDINDPSGLHSALIIALYEDHLGNIWVGTQDQGAALYNIKTHRFQHITMAHGLPAKTVSGFIEDRQQNLWLATTNGLARLNRASGNIRVLQKENGLVGNNFNRKANWIDEQGRLYFGGADGLSVFDPTQVFIDDPEFQVIITEFRVFNLAVGIGDGQPLSESIILADKVTLKHTDTMFSLDFSALNYRQSVASRYAYKLDGFDQSWNSVRDMPTATYTNIAPGHYTFRVRASRKNLWLESDPLTIVVLPPPSMSKPAKLVYLILALAMLVFVFKFWHLHIRAKVYKSLSTEDSLTGIKNRHGLMQQIDRRYSAVGSSRSLCLIFLDVDYFKRINDHRGHHAGDVVLHELAAVVRNSVRKSDVVGRWGGEEFLIICADINLHEAVKLAEKIRHDIASHIFGDAEAPLKVTASFGVTLVQHAETFHETFQRVDHALYQAKTAGRNCVMFV